MANNLNIEQIPLETVGTNELEPKPETKLEREKQIEKVESKKTGGKAKASVPDPSAAPLELVEVDSYEQRQIQAIEDVLAGGLDKTFLEMNPSERARFKIEGEKTALKINVILSKARVSADKIVNLIKDWLKLIPGVNRFFLEQEAKIKTDKILNIKKSL